MAGGRDRFRSEDALSTYLREQGAAVIRGELALRTDADTRVVDDTRAALRRLRGAVGSFAALLAPSATELRDVDEDLRWLAGLLSDVRDADVLAERLRTSVAELPAELALGDVGAEIAEALAGVRRRTVEHWQAQRTTDRFRATLRLVARWYDRPPLAGEPVSDTLLRRRGGEILDVEEKRARNRLKRSRSGDPELLLRAGRALTRLRYAAEVLDPVLPRAARVGQHARTVQQRLGDPQDLMLEVAFLRHQATVLGWREGHNAFSYGVLLARAEQQAEEIRQRKVRW